MRSTQRQTLKQRPHKTAMPASARGVFEHTDLADAWSLRIAPGMPTDPQTWADATFHHPPGWVAGLLYLRNRLVRLIGVPPASRQAFATLARREHEVMLGTDDVHLDFRAIIVVVDGIVTLSTVARANNRRGHFYLAVVRVVHPAIIRAMLRGAGRRLTERQLPPLSG